MLYVIGDSHQHAFEGNPLFTLRGIGGATAYNLKNEHSTSNSNKKLFEIVNSIDKQKDTIILVVGETDCRIHIYYQYKKQQEKIGLLKLVLYTVLSYGEVMKQLKRMGVKFVICGIPPAGWEPNLNHYPYYATPELHAHIYYEFNALLKTYCLSYGYPYLDIYSKTVGPDGHIKPEYAEDQVHLNLKAQPLLIEMLKEEGIL